MIDSFGNKFELPMHEGRKHPLGPARRFNRVNRGVVHKEKEQLSFLEFVRLVKLSNSLYR